MLNLFVSQPINLERAIARKPLLTVSPETPLPEIIELFHGARGKACELVNTPTELQIIPTCVFVVNQEQLVGIVTERDLVKLVAKGGIITNTSTVAEIMSHPVIALPEKELKDIFEVLNLFRINKIRHLPILNEQGSPLGCITHETLRQVLRSVDLLRLRSVKEIMHPNVIHAPLSTSILAIAQLMAHHRVSCIVIAEALSPHSAEVHYKPLGIITERDIIQFQALGLDVREIRAEVVMSCPLTLVSSNESLEHAYDTMKQKRITRLVVTGTEGELAGIITQSSVLQILDPSEMYGLINILQDKVNQLETEKINILENRNDELKKLVETRTIELKWQAQSEQLKSKLMLKIRNSSELPNILEMAVTEIRDFLAADRVAIYQFNYDLSGTIVSESVGEGWTATINENIHDTCLQGGLNIRYRQGWYWAMENIERAGLTDCHRELLARFEVKSNLVLPILVADVEPISALMVIDDPLLLENLNSKSYVWGLLIVHQCSQTRDWSENTIALLKELTDQMAIAIRQSVAVTRANQEINNRKILDEKLEESNSKWTSFLENSPNLVYTLDRQAIVLSVNHFQAGENPRSIIGKSFYDLTPSYLRERRKEQIENVLHMGIVITDDGERPNLDGSLKYYQVQIIPVWQLRKIIKILVVFIDISDRKKAEIVIQRSEALLKESQRIAHLGSWEFDIQNNFLSWSDEIYRIFEVDKDQTEISYVNFLNLVHPDDRSYVDLAYQESVKNKTPYNIVHRLLMNDGRIKYVREVCNTLYDDRGEPVHSMGTVQDITDYQLKEIALEENEARLQEAQTTARLGNWRFEVDTQKVSWSKEIFEIFCLNPDQSELNYENMTDYFHPDDQKRRAELVERAIKFAEPYETDFKIIRGDGSCAYVFSKGQPVVNLEGRVTHLTGIIMDISDRKQAEESLKNSEQRFRQLAENIQQFFYLNDIKNNQVLYISPSYETIWQRSCQSLYDQPQSYLDTILPEDRAMAINAYRQQRLGEKTEIQYRISRPDGSIRWILDRTFPILDDFGTVYRVCGIAEDISDRKEIADDLNQLKERLSLVLQGANDGWWDFDIVRDDVYLSPRWWQMLGYEEGEMESSVPVWLTLIHPDDVDHVYSILEQIFHNSSVTTAELEYRLRHKQGHYVPVLSRGYTVRDEHGKPLRNTGTNTDLTVLKQKEQELQAALEELNLVNRELEDRVEQRTAEVIASETRYRRIVETANEGIWMIDTEGKTTFANQKIASMLGVTPQEMLNKTLFDFMDDEHRNYADQLLSRRLQGLQEQHDFQFKRADGSDLWVIIAASPIQDSEGNCIGSLGLITDISDRKEAEKQLQNSYEQLAITNAELARATRLKDEFLANMSHELRTPLNAILGFSESLQEGVFGGISEKQRKPLRTIEKSGEHLLSLINDILDLAKIESGKLSIDKDSISLISLCESSLNFIRQQAFKKQIKVQFTPPTLIADFFADERRLRQILINLLNNAVKFTPNGGEVSLEVSLDCFLDQPILNFMIKDTGIGIAKEDLPKLFQSFVQIDSRLARQYEGTGLGLALVERLAKLHGGRVSVSSNVGQGSCFAVHLPYFPVNIINATPTLASTRETEVNFPASIKSALILLVEDNLNNAQTISTYLEHKGYRLMCACNGQEALEIIQQSKPDLILMDVQMPIMDGLEATRQIRSNPKFSQIPIIALTALAMPGDRDQCLAAGMNDYLSKPIRMKQLMTLIEQNLLK